jgi:hypothetical protein
MWGKNLAILSILSLSLMGCAASNTAAGTEEKSSASPSQTRPAPPIVRPDWDNLRPGEVRNIAYSETLEYLKNSQPVADPINHLFTPQADREVAQRTLDKMPDIAGYLAEVAIPDNFTVVWTDDRDAESAVDFLCR